MKALRLLLLGTLLPLLVKTQSVIGCWYGTAFISGTSESQHNYLIELLVTENGQKVEGILNYYFRNLFRSLPVSGQFLRNRQQLVLTDVPIVFYKSMLQREVDCNMDGLFTLVLARAGSTLNGQWNPTKGYKYTCPPIQVRLSLDKSQKITDSLRRTIRNWKEQYQTWIPPPLQKEEKALAIIPRTVENPQVTASKSTREEEVIDLLQIDDDSVLVSLYDNGEVDGDSISLFMNGKLIATHQRLTARALQLTLPLDSLSEYTELTMFAENLGAIPPNTALMIVKGGGKTFQLRLTSTLEKSASVRFKRARKLPPAK